MGNYDLSYMLDIIGKLKDSNNEDSAASRFRKHLTNKVNSIDTIRPYVNECLGKGGSQFNRALQDIVNHIGELLEFDVEYGRYKGKKGEPGHDGLWQSKEGQSVIVETKTTNAYTIKTSQILNYRNELVDAGRIDKDKSLGLYVVGRKDTDETQLENSIIAGGRERELRTISIASLLDLLEIKQRYDVDHEIILSILVPAGASVDPYIDLIANLIEQEEEEKEAIKKRQEKPKKKTKTKEEVVRLDPNKPIKYHGDQSVAFAKVDKALFGEFEGMTAWKDIVRKAIKNAINKGKREFIENNISIVKEIDGDSFSMRDADADECCATAVKIAKELDEPLRIEFHWRNRDGAYHPGKSGEVVYPNE